MKFICLVLVGMLAALTLGAAGVYADDIQVGAAELDLLERIFTGNIGLTLGLGVAIMGIISFTQGNTGGGITLVVVGVLITLLPGVFNGMRTIVCPIAGAMGGHCGASPVAGDGKD